MILFQPPGLFLFHGTNGLNWNNFIGLNIYPNNPTYTGRQDDLMSPGVRMNWYYGIRYQSLFVAPTTGNYKFRIFCDDLCEFRISNNELKSNAKLIINDKHEASTFFQYR